MNPTELTGPISPKASTGSKSHSSESFSDDVCFEISRFLDFRFILKTCVLISKQWSEVIRNRSSLCITFNMNKMAENLESLLNGPYTASIASFTVKSTISKDQISLIATIRNLTKLEIPCHNIKDDDITPIESLTNLTHLNVWGNEITQEGTKLISKLAQLTELMIESNPIGNEGLVYLTDMTKLRILNISGCKINKDGFKHITKLQNLTNLAVSSTKLENDSMMNICKMKELRILRAQTCGIDKKLVQYLIEMTQLKTLNISNNFIGDEGMCFIGKLTNLEILLIFNCGITSLGAEQFTHLINLRELNVSGNSINDEGISFISTLKELNSLSISKVSVDDEGFKLLSKLKKLTQLYANNNPIADSGVIKLIKENSQLKSLKLNRTWISNETLKKIGENLYKLERLDVGETRITPEGIHCLKDLKKLKYLGLHRNLKIGNEGAKAVCQLDQLIGLNISDCNLNDEAVEFISQMKQLHNLHISNKNMETCVPFTELTKLKILSINWICMDERLLEMKNLKYLTLNSPIHIDKFLEHYRSYAKHFIRLSGNVKNYFEDENIDESPGSL